MDHVPVFAILDWMNTKIGQTKTTVLGGIGLLAMIYIGHVWWTTKHVVKTAVSFLVAGAVLFAVSNTDFFKGQFEKETTDAGLGARPAAVSVYQGPAGPTAGPAA